MSNSIHPETAHQMAECAAKWWADKLRGKVNHDNGDYSITSAFAMVLADIVAIKHPASEEQIDRFQVILTGLIQNKIQEEPTRRLINFGCDYGPGWLLSDAAEEASIDPILFPYKTWMYIMPEKGEVDVCDGYRAAPKNIFSCHVNGGVIHADQADSV
ncbi:MAG: hypothetical protein IKN04_13460 [Clostridia bacterium]|nr:hypothetical protein [Clostridia bacterium]